MIPIVTDSLKAVQMCTAKMIKNNNNIELHEEYNLLHSTIEYNLNMMNDRNDLIIEHRRSTTLLVEKTNELFRQGIELITLNE